ncbi:MAG: hypothetical protein ABIS50_13880 [Luteolibacter sp.]
MPPIGNQFHTGGQTGPQAANPMVTEPYQGTVYLRFESTGGSRVVKPAAD